MSEREAERVNGRWVGLEVCGKEKESPPLVGGADNALTERVLDGLREEEKRPEREAMLWGQRCLREKSERRGFYSDRVSFCVCL